MIKRIVLLILVCSVWWYGAIALFWIVPDRNNTIQQQQGRIAVLKSHISDLERLNEKLIIAQNFEDLFVLCAKPQPLMNIQKLNDFIKSKKEFCLGNHENPS